MAHAVDLSEEVRFASEMVFQSRKVDISRRGDLPQRGSRIALASEELRSHLNDSCARSDAVGAFVRSR